MCKSENPLRADKLPGITPNTTRTRHNQRITTAALRLPSNRQTPMPDNTALTANTPPTTLSRRFSVAPMMDWADLF
jgi:hypothetical protein